MKNEKIIVGLTGGIASGKTVVSDMLCALGCGIVDADIVSRFVTRSGGAADEKMREAFPYAYCDGVLDRLKLRKAVFENKPERAKLNAITRPLIEKECIRAISSCEKDIVVLVAPLLFESKFNLLTDFVITVSTDTSSRILRLMARDKIDESLARKMIDAQLSDEERGKKSDYILYNNTTIDELRAQVIKVYLDIKSNINFTT